MEPIALFLLLSGVLSSCHCGPAQYHFESRPLNWTEAQQYCREKTQSDLVTITSQEDHTRFNEYVQQLGYSDSIWIGLYDDVNSWKWSLDGRSLEQTGYIRWHGNEPSNNRGQPCGELGPNGFFDHSCLFPRFFVCYDEANEGRENQYVFVREAKSWYDAQSHCRQHYTDLASVRNSAEDAKLVEVSGRSRIKIGLYRDYWEWSDQNPSMFSAWQPGRPSIPTGKENCAYYQDGGWVDSLCSKEKAFICNSAPRSQVVRIAIKMDSPANMEDPAIQAALAEQIRQKLQDNGQAVGRISWKSQPDGKVFHQQKNKQTRKKREKRSDL